MPSIELTSAQKSILTALIHLYEEQEDAVKGESIADEVNRNPGTIGNQIQSLKALNWSREYRVRRTATSLPQTPTGRSTSSRTIQAKTFIPPQSAVLNRC